MLYHKNFRRFDTDLISRHDPNEVSYLIRLRSLLIRRSKLFSRAEDLPEVGFLEIRTS